MRAERGRGDGPGGWEGPGVGGLTGVQAAQLRNLRLARSCTDATRLDDPEFDTPLKQLMATGAPTTHVAVATCCGHTCCETRLIFDHRPCGAGCYDCKGGTIRVIGPDQGGGSRQ